MFRHPHTQNERKANLHHIQESRVEGYPLPVRLKRRILPSNWDDLYPSNIRNKSWKENRQTQYKH
jgi:hypothetical protein